MTENEEGEFREKEFEFFLLLNWRTGDVKLYKRRPKPKYVSPYHIPVKQKFVVKIPRGSELETEGEIILGRKKVSELSAALLKEEEK